MSNQIEYCLISIMNILPILQIQKTTSMIVISIEEKRERRKVQLVLLKNSKLTLNHLYIYLERYLFIVIIIPIGNCNADFKDSGDESCSDYANNNYCTSDGSNDGYGTEWNKDEWGSFDDYKNDDGETALVCPECGCKGGIKQFFIILILHGFIEF